MEDVPDLERSTVRAKFAGQLEAAYRPAGSRAIQDMNLLSQGYIAIERLGRGAFGEVILVKRTDGSGKYVAIKKIVCTTERDAETAQREALTLKSAKHACILELLHCFIISDSNSQHCAAYLVTEYCENGSLMNHLYTQGPISWKVRMQWFEQLLHGLAYLHSNNIVHRDLKMSWLQS